MIVHRCQLIAIQFVARNNVFRCQSCAITVIITKKANLRVAERLEGVKVPTPLAPHPPNPDGGSPSAKTLVGYLGRSSPDDSRRRCRQVGDVSRPDVVRRKGKPLLRVCSSSDEGLPRDVARWIVVLSKVAPVDFIGSDGQSGDGKGSGNAVKLERHPWGKTVVQRQRTSELKRFATDFLWLYCSDLPSPVNVTVQQEVKSQKRDGSPSLLVDCNTIRGKKQCV